MAQALPIAALAMQLIGGVVQGIGAKHQADAQATVDDKNSLLSLQSGEQDAYETARQARLADGDAVALMGGSGAALGTGSAADILTDAARQRERDVATIRAKARAQSDAYAQSAKDTRKAGKNALITGIFGGAAQALAGANDLRNARLKQAQVGAERSTVLGSYGTSYGEGIVDPRRYGGRRDPNVMY